MDRDCGLAGAALAADDRYGVHGGLRVPGRGVRLLYSVRNGIAEPFNRAVIGSSIDGPVHEPMADGTRTDTGASGRPPEPGDGEDFFDRHEGDLCGVLTPAP